ncbi:MAG: hypothetical protein KDB71_04780 [Mycobacterium sp.]|nr:hypothetical protein [Mycobacterium sp.]
MTTVSARSFLAAGLAAATVGSIALAPVPTPGGKAAVAITSPAIQLSAALQPLIQPAETAPSSPAPAAAAPQASAIGAGSAGNTIINVYNAVEPWVAWGYELAQWALSFVPGLWWVAPGIDMFYFTVEPLVQSAVYSFAYLIDGEPSLIGPTIRAGIQQAANNFVIYGIAWIESIVPFPPLPPFPIFPVASVAATRAANRVAAATAAATPEAATQEATASEAIPPAATTQEATEAVTRVEDQIAAAPAPTRARVGRNPLRSARHQERPGTTHAAPAASTPAPIPASTDATEFTGTSNPVPAPAPLARTSPTRNAQAADRKVRGARSSAHTG